MNTRAAKKPADEEEVDPPEAAEDDDDDDGDDDDDEEDEDDDDDDGEMTEDEVAKDVASAIRDAHEGCVSAIAEKKRVLLDLDDDSRWLLVIKRRD